MSKCPICGGDMIAGGICHYNQDCPIHDQNVPTEVLELLDRTRKALDVAVDALKKVRKCHNYTTDEGFVAYEALYKLGEIEQIKDNYKDVK